MKNQIIQGDCLKVLRRFPPNYFDLGFGSPPYEDARTYGIDFNLKSQEWVDWMVEVYKASLRVCKGLVAFVVQGRTRKYRWSATPALLMADLHRTGINLRRPAIYQRFGIPGSGGPDWLRCNYEYIICASPPGRLLWSNNIAMGAPPKYRPGGAMSYRMKNGQRVNGKMVYEITATDGYSNGDTAVKKTKYAPPEKTNPGSIIHCNVGGGAMGSRLCHLNEAPFSEKLAEFMIKSFCPPGGIVFDPFCGSGTTLAVAERLGRKWVGIDIRRSQVDLSNKRIEEVIRKQIDAME